MITLLPKSSNTNTCLIVLEIGSPKDNMNGSEVHSYYWNGNLEDIKKYCESDVRASIEVSKKIYI
jgi:predicted PolB exonuclease-like 3'-5' exonuclease